MVIGTPIIRQYAKAVFTDHTRTLNSVPVAQKEGVKEYAALGVIEALNRPAFYIEDIAAALSAETITEAQYDEILLLNPDMQNRPGPAPTEAPAE